MAKMASFGLDLYWDIGRLIFGPFLATTGLSLLLSGSWRATIIPAEPVPAFPNTRVFGI
jgi:hypothetical protein